MTDCEKVITSTGKKGRYLCDYCEKVFDKDNVTEVKWRWMTTGSFLGYHFWHRNYMCKDCFYKRVRYNDKHDYVEH